MFGQQSAYNRHPQDITVHLRKFSGASRPLYRRQGSAASTAQREVEAIHESKGAIASDRDIVDKMPKTSLTQALLPDPSFLGWLVPCTERNCVVRMRTAIASLH
jgi:hypothetical protein